MSTKIARQKLAEALKYLPGEFGLSTTRQHMVNALKSLTKYDEKYNKKKGEQLNIHQQYWGEIEARAIDQPMSEVSPEAVIKTLQFLDNMIDAEKLKIENLNQPETKTDAVSDLLKD